MGNKENKIKRKISEIFRSQRNENEIMNSEQHCKPMHRTTHTHKKKIEISPLTFTHDKFSPKTLDIDSMLSGVVIQYCLAHEPCIHVQ